MERRSVDTVLPSVGLALLLCVSPLSIVISHLFVRSAKHRIILILTELIASNTVFSNSENACNEIEYIVSQEPNNTQYN
jgi:hypothetical protein